MVLVPLGGVLAGSAPWPSSLADVGVLLRNTGADLASGHAFVFGGGGGGGAHVPVLTYIGANFAYNVAMTMLLAHPRAGAALMALLGAAKLPLLSVAFSLPALMGAAGAEPLPPRTPGGLAAILAGLALYRSER